MWPLFRHASTRVVAALLLACAAVLASLLLWSVHGVYRESAQLTAARDVFEHGKGIARTLAGHPNLKQTETGVHDWTSFGRLFDYLKLAEPALQSVSVLRDDIVLFERQAQPLMSPAATPENGGEPRPIRVLSRLIGHDEVPVILFGADIEGTESPPVRIEVALKREAVGRRVSLQSEAAQAMLKVAMLTIVGSFGACSVLIIWLMRRESRREALLRAEQHLAFAGVLANGIVHDFRNPMSSLRLDAQMLSREVAHETQFRRERLRKLSSRIVSTLDRMDQVFNEFLYLSKPTDAKPEPVELLPCVRECIELLAARFERAELRVELSAPEGSLCALANASSLRRAIVNVLVNAIQFSPRQESVEIVVRSRANRALIEVLDRGPGIERARRKAVFDMFVTTRPEGTGLGLFLTRTAVERVGGCVQAEPRPGGGTCIRIELPLVQPLNAPPTPIQSNPEETHERTDDTHL